MADLARHLLAEIDDRGLAEVALAADEVAEVAEAQACHPFGGAV